VTLPFPEDRVRATVARYRAVLATTTKTMDVVTESMASGALTPRQLERQHEAEGRDAQETSTQRADACTAHETVKP
jgi:hypothetical protein